MNLGVSIGGSKFWVDGLVEALVVLVLIWLDLRELGGLSGMGRFEMLFCCEVAGLEMDGKTKVLD